MGAVNCVQRRTVEVMELMELMEPNQPEMQRKLDLQREIEQILRLHWPTCRVLAFGSSKSGLGFGNSDLDLGIYFEDVNVEDQGHFAPLERIQLLAVAMRMLEDQGFEIVHFVRNARVPILKFWDRTHEISCDLCLGSVHALLNTALLKFYCQIDPRVRPLAFAVKYWAKQRGINDSTNGTLSSYAYSLLLIFYLQSQSAGRLLPCVHPAFYQAQKQLKIDDLLSHLESLESVAMTYSSSTYGTCEANSVGALLAGFFQFYASEFNVEDCVVSVRMAETLSKTTKWSHPVPWRLSIEDPFELMHDIGRVVFSTRGQEIICSEFSRAIEMFGRGEGFAAICACEASTELMNSGCYLCESKDHRPRACSTLNNRLERKFTGCGNSITSVLEECWYCGEMGHYKANCPLLAFRSIALPSSTLDSSELIQSPPLKSAKPNRDGIGHSTSPQRYVLVPAVAASPTRTPTPPFSRKSLHRRRVTNTKGTSGMDTGSVVSTDGSGSSMGNNSTISASRNGRRRKKRNRSNSSSQLSTSAAPKRSASASARSVSKLHGPRARGNGSCGKKVLPETKKQLAPALLVTSSVQ